MGIAVMTITLDEAKDYLDVIHDADDSKIQMLLDAAHDEALQFMGREEFGEVCECSSSSSSSGPVMPASVRLGVLILLQAAYQASPDDAEQLRHVAEVKLMPYRCGLGV